MLIEPEETRALHHADQHKINLADFALSSDILGPGRRALIWVQGCPRRCPGCMSQHMLAFTQDREWITPQALAERVLACQPIEGITLLGGEPFSHAAQLAVLIRILRQAADLGVVVYTGHTYERILARQDSHWNALLNLTDLLIDGEYREEVNSDLLWRGSANQRLLALTPRYRAFVPTVAQQRERRIELSLTATGALRIIGMPERGFIDDVVRRLHGYGVEVKLDTFRAEPELKDNLSL